MHSYTKLLLAFGALLLTACKKETVLVPEEEPAVSTAMKRGLPPRPDSTHGYLYAGYSFPYESEKKPAINLFAFFGDPARRLTSNFDAWSDAGKNASAEHKANINVKSVLFNTHTDLFWNNNTSVYSFQSEAYPHLLNGKASWQVTGNLTFEPFSVDLAHGFPQIVDSSVTFLYDGASSVKFDPGSYFSNFDSAGVRINSLDKKFILQKTVAAGKGELAFSQQELSFLSKGSSNEIVFFASNYAHMTVKNKKHIFQLSSKFYKRFMSE